MTTPAPYISICIPAYKRLNYLQRLLQSVSEQTFRDFEVIITDDSPDNSVADFIASLDAHYPLIYHKNPESLGTPANWNEGIRMARGEWIKLIHDDDWFASPSALAIFADTARSSPHDLIFSAFNNVFESGKISPVFCSSFQLRSIRNNPVTLVARNSIGPPSVIMHRRDDRVQYDTRMKWLVDMDFYMRFLALHSFEYIPDLLINIGISESQVTKTASLVPEVEIPEHMLLADKTGIYALRNLLVYDAWWRLMRNLGIRDEEAIRKAGYTRSIPKTVRRMIAFQRRFPTSLLFLGPCSKLLMVTCYLLNRPPAASLSTRNRR